MKIPSLAKGAIAALLMVFSVVPRAESDPLTAMAVIGLAFVTAAATADQTILHERDTRDMRAAPDSRDAGDRMTDQRARSEENVVAQDGAINRGPAPAAVADLGWSQASAAPIYSSVSDTTSSAVPLKVRSKE